MEIPGKEDPAGGRQAERDRGRQLHKAADNLYPNQRLQERVFNIVPYLIKYGYAFLEKLDQAVDIGEHDHQVVVIDESDAIDRSFKEIVMELDALAFGAHADDVELACGGTLVALAALGHKTGVIVLTQGEMGTRGSARIRAREFAASAKILGLAAHRMLDIPDGRVEVTWTNKLKIIKSCAPTGRRSSSPPIGWTAIRTTNRHPILCARPPTSPA